VIHIFGINDSAPAENLTILVCKKRIVGRSSVSATARGVQKQQSLDHLGSTEGVVENIVHVLSPDPAIEHVDLWKEDQRTLAAEPTAPDHAGPRVDLEWGTGSIRAPFQGFNDLEGA
jgi:hypothetical protein